MRDWTVRGRGAAGGDGRGAFVLMRKRLVRILWRRAGGGLGGMRWLVRGRRMRWSPVSGATAFFLQRRRVEVVFLVR